MKRSPVFFQRDIVLNLIQDIIPNHLRDPWFILLASAIIGYNLLHELNLDRPPRSENGEEKTWIHKTAVDLPQL